MSDRGYSLIEVLVVGCLLAALTTTAVPLAGSTVDRARTAAAARYLAGKLMQARLEAIKRSRFVAVQFVPRVDGYWFRPYMDGNGNGVLAADISRGIDTPIGIEERLDQQFPGVTFGICSSVTAIVVGDLFDPANPVQIGRSTLVSFNPNGSSTAGTLYVRGTQANQAAVRVLGTTARSRTFHFDFQDRQWRTP